MSYRDDVDALAARHTALETELAEKTREVADAARLLEEAREKRRLPMLDNLRVAAPCKAKWDDMVGDARVRHCIECNKDVFNLSGLTRVEAEALLVENNGALCVRFYQRADGTILTTDCTVGGSKRRKRRLIAAGAAALLASGAGVMLRGMTMMGAPVHHDVREIQGGSASLPEPEADPPGNAMQGQAMVQVIGK